MVKPYKKEEHRQNGGTDQSRERFAFNEKGRKFRRDPEQVVAAAANWLIPGGNIIAIAPNSESLQRQAAVRMGLLPSVNAFSERDQVRKANGEYSIEKNFDDYFWVRDWKSRFSGVTG